MARKDEHGRTVVPLVMLPGNLQALINNTISVNGISLEQIESDAFSGEGVVLTVVMTPEQKKLALALGFRTTSQ